MTGRAWHSPLQIARVSVALLGKRRDEEGGRVRACMREAASSQRHQVRTRWSATRSRSSDSSFGGCTRMMPARELVQYPEAKRVTKKVVEESLFPASLDVELLRLHETCGVCLGDFSEDVVVPSSPSLSSVHTPEDGEAREPTSAARKAEDDDVLIVEARRGSRDPLRDIGLLTGCTHTYHFFCIEKWGKQRENSCPQCKARFSWIGRYNRRGRRLCCCRVGLKNQKDTAEVPVSVDYLQQQQQQQLCRVCSTLIAAAEELRCSDQLCWNAFHFVCAGFDALPACSWFCPDCRASGICRDAEGRRVPASRISPEGLLLPPRARGRRPAATAAAEDEQQQEREREELVESLSNEVIRRINRRARHQQDDEEEGASERPRPRRRASRGRRGAAAAAAGAAVAAATAVARGGQRRERQRQQRDEACEDDVYVCAADGSRASVADIDYRRLGAPAAAAAVPEAAATSAPAPAAPPARLGALHSGFGAAASEPSLDAPRMLRFYLRPEGPAQRSSSWLLQRKLDVVRLRQERREALRRQEALRRLEEQANVVCSGVSIENSSGSALVEDLLQHHDQLVRRHTGHTTAGRHAAALRHSDPVVTSPPSRSECVQQQAAGEGAGESESEVEGAQQQHQLHAREGGGSKRRSEEEDEDDGCSILAKKCQELLKEEAQRRAEVSDDLIRAQILLDIDRARTKFCDEAAKARAALRLDCHNEAAASSEAAEASAPTSRGPSVRREDEPAGEGEAAASRSPHVSQRVHAREHKAERQASSRSERKRKHAKLKPSQALVDRVKRCMMPFMVHRHPSRGETYRAEYKQICRHISEGLTRRHEGPLLPMSDAERSHYWEINFVEIQTAVQDYFERADEGPLDQDEGEPHRHSDRGALTSFWTEGVEFPSRALGESPA
ncbi:hypothetical protein ACSSS7_001808 [Eimeria intestinalis]